VSIVLDTQAALIFYMGEKGAGRVADLLTQIYDGKTKGYMSVVNLAEFYHILARKSRKVADEKEANLRGFGIKAVPALDDDLWKEAALLKTNHALSLADAFAAATAKTLKAKLVIGSDPEFDRIDGVQIEKIDSRRADRLSEEEIVDIVRAYRKSRHS
jgi:predicted nucleic acid-binding protein